MIERAVIGLRRQRADQPLRQAREILRAVERPRAVGLRLLGIEIVDDDQIEIGGRRHLAAAELAEREQRGLLPADAAVAAANSSSTARCSARISDVGEPRESLAGLLGRHRAGQDARADQEHLLLAEQAQPVEEVLVGRAPRRACAASSASSLASSGSAPKKRRLEQRIHHLRMARQDRRRAAARCRASSATSATRSGFCRSSENSRAAALQSADESGRTRRAPRPDFPARARRSSSTGTSSASCARANSPRSDG